MRAADYRVPFNRPHRTGNEPALLAEVMSGVLTGNGPFNLRAAGLLSPLVGGGSCLLTPSCTHALEMAALLLDLAPGDEVILPSFTFVSTANAFVLRGAVPVFVDIRGDTFNIDESLVEAAVTSRTRAVVPVHYGRRRLRPRPARRDRRAARNRPGRGQRPWSRRSIPWRSARLVRGAGDPELPCHQEHPVRRGRGLVVNDETLLARAEVLREKGTDRSRFDRGQIDKYTWVDSGRATCSPTCSPLSWRPSWSSSTKSSAGATGSGAPTTNGCEAGDRSRASALRKCRRSVTIPPTSTRSSCRSRSSARA